MQTRRGIYRLLHFPATEHDEPVIAWLWSEQVGVVSHETALAEGERAKLEEQTSGFDGWTRTSRHIEVRDGTRLAIDIVFPAQGGASAEGLFPAVWALTPYNRSRYERGRFHHE